VEANLADPVKAFTMIVRDIAVVTALEGDLHPALTSPLRLPICVRTKNAKRGGNTTTRAAGGVASGGV